MNANLLYLYERYQPIRCTVGENELIRDLKLDIILDAMADHDSYLRDLCKKLLLHPSLDKSEIMMRQEVTKEALKHTDFFISLYKISVADMENTLSYKELLKPKYNKIVSVTHRVNTYVELDGIHLSFLEQIRERILLSQSFISCPILKDLCEEILQKYTSAYIQGAKRILQGLTCLKIDAEIVLGCHIGTGLKPSDVKLHSISEPEKSHTRKFRREKSDAIILLDNIVHIYNSQEIIDSGLGYLLKVLKDFNQECSLFFEKIREMFGFFAGIINLYKILSERGVSVCFPNIFDNTGYSFCELVDIGLVLKNDTPVVGNTMSFSHKNLCIITGMNQGGKTTFLRSLGLAQIMSQCGLFITATSFSCNIFNGIYTHFPNEEDKTLKYGLLEQEMCQLKNLVSQLKPGSLLLMNEPFSTTSEYDASLMAEQIISAFCKCNITIFLVTHLYEYAHKLFLAESEDCIFYRAGGFSDSQRTFQLKEGEPLRSGVALDLYHQIID